MRQERSGYVLVMVMALLVISATLLVTISRSASRSAFAARDAEEMLQRRWAVTSARKALLSYIEPILAALEQQHHRPAPSYTISMPLSGQTIELRLADEQAKANVNAMLEAVDLSRSETRLRQGLSGTGLLNRIKLRPTLGNIIETIEPTTRPIATQPAPLALTVNAWGQVFDNLPPGQLLRPGPGSRLAPVDLLTLWGNGAINVRRTTDSAVALVAGNSVSGAEISRLIAARDALFNSSNERPGLSPGDNLHDQMIKTVGASLAARGNLGLAQVSTCHSLWIITRTARRDSYDLFVLDQTNPRRAVTWSYSW